MTLENHLDEPLWLGCNGWFPYVMDNCHWQLNRRIETPLSSFYHGGHYIYHKIWNLFLYKMVRRVTWVFWETFEHSIFRRQLFLSFTVCLLNLKGSIPYVSIYYYLLFLNSNKLCVNFRFYILYLVRCDKTRPLPLFI